MCHGGVGSILVMFDVLDCYILYICLLLFVYCIVYIFWKLPNRGGRQNMNLFLKKILMFVDSPTNIRATWGRRG
jgi:4-hydroxybenzoate polyprenyltransferase